MAPLPVKMCAKLSQGESASPLGDNFMRKTPQACGPASKETGKMDSRSFRLSILSGRQAYLMEYKEEVDPGGSNLEYQESSYSLHDAGNDIHVLFG